MPNNPQTTPEKKYAAYKKLLDNHNRRFGPKNERY